VRRIVEEEEAEKRNKKLPESLLTRHWITERHSCLWNSHPHRKDLLQAGRPVQGCGYSAHAVGISVCMHTTVKL
jgi:hypothetical protein